mgnify:FL=1
MVSYLETLHIFLLAVDRVSSQVDKLRHVRYLIIHKILNQLFDAQVGLLVNLVQVEYQDCVALSAQRALV